VRILLDKGIGISSYGLSNAFNTIGHQALLWDHQAKPAFDIFTEFEPELFLCATSNINKRDIQKNLDARQSLRVLLFKDESEIIGFDDVIYRKGKPAARFKCDIIYLGRFEEWKLDYLAAIVKKGLSLKVFSISEYPLINYLGQIDNQDIPDAYVSAKVCINLSQLPSEDIYRILGCGGLPVSTVGYADFPMMQFMENKPNEFANLVYRLINGEMMEEVKSIMAGRQLILDRHTYKYRAKQILDSLGNNNA